jgi:hypothetical protein
MFTIAVCVMVMTIGVQSVQQVLGQVSALTWALTVDPNLFVAGSEVVSAAKEAFALADRDEVTLLQRLVRGDWPAAITADLHSRHCVTLGSLLAVGCLDVLMLCMGLLAMHTEKFTVLIETQCKCMMHQHAPVCICRGLTLASTSLIGAVAVLLCRCTPSPPCVQPGRDLTIEVMTQLRVACIDLLNVLMAWEPFRTLPEPVSWMLLVPWDLQRLMMTGVNWLGAVMHCKRSVQQRIEGAGIMVYAR